MKAIIFYGAMLFGLTTFSQSETEVLTTSIKIEDFITHIASKDNNASEERIYLAIETGEQGLTLEERFYLEQGIKLLSKRISENSLIAIGCYGSQDRLIIPYTPVSGLTDITTVLNTISSHSIKTQTDGIDLAFNMADSELKEGIKNTVIILRNTPSKHNSENTISATIATPITPEFSDKKEKTATVNHTKLGGAIALTAITILPDVLQIIKN